MRSTAPSAGSMVLLALCRLYPAALGGRVHPLCENVTAQNMTLVGDRPYPKELRLDRHNGGVGDWDPERGRNLPQVSLGDDQSRLQTATNVLSSGLREKQ